MIFAHSHDSRADSRLLRAAVSKCLGRSRVSTVFAAVSLILAAAPTTHAERLDRNNLLAFRNERQEIAPVRSIADWQRRRAEIIAGMQEVMGPFPGATKRIPLEVKVEEEVDCGTYVRRKINYASEPGSRVPAYLLIPKVVLDGSAQRPGVLCLMPTSNTVGHKIVVGLGEDTPAAKNRSYAKELAERGYVTIAPAYPLLAGYNPDLEKLGYRSGTMKAIWDNVRALDVMAALPNVKTGGFGVIGHSLGGHNSIFTAVFDDRIKAVVSSCGFDSFLDYRDARYWEAGKGWTQALYMPRILDYSRDQIPFDFHELLGAIAPRAVFVNAPVRDSNFKWQSVDRVVAAASQIYRLYDVPNLIRVHHPDTEHDFVMEARELAYATLERALW